VQYCLRSNKDDLEQVLLEAEPLKHYAVPIDHLGLTDADANLGNLLLAEPLKMLPLLESALLDAQSRVLEGHQYKAAMTYKHNVHPRLGHLPNCSEYYRSTMPVSSDISRFIAISGTYCIQAG